MGSIRKSFAPILSSVAVVFVTIFGTAFRASAIIDANLQMQLGNPSGATADPTNHNHYLIQRTVEALDYSDNLGEPNWTSWDLTSSDLGSSGRSSTFYADTSLPAGFYVVPPNSYSGSGWDRGHMCPSADRTDNATDNNEVFLMSNIIPQNSSLNSGLWGDFEGYCRSMLSTSELLITCGPRGFDGTTIASGHVYVPSYNWKIVVCAPLGIGTALSRITNANPASIRVIAIDVTNAAPSLSSWTNYVTSAKQVGYNTGFTFFNALPNNLAWVLRSKVDGQTPTAPSIASFSPSSGPPSNSVTITGVALDTITNVTFNGTVASYTITATNQITALVPPGASSGQITVKGLGGSTTSASSFTVTTPVVPDFTITPTGTFSSSGDQGGPFSPTTQVYTLNNTNATTLNWAAGKNATWLDLSASSGTLAGGGSTDITVTVNSAAASLLGGMYSDTVTFSNSMTGGWVARSVNLTVLAPGYLSVTPVKTFEATAQVGGPYASLSQDYTLSNTGSLSMNWTANATASWLSLSATSGTLAGGSSTVVTVTISSNAINLAQGNYTDELGFTNTTNHGGDAVRDVSLDVVNFGFFDDFGSFSSGDLVGQSEWQESGITNVLWTFEGDSTNAYAGMTTTVVGDIAADVGSGVASGMHANASSAWTAVSGNGSASSWSVNHWGVGDFFQFQVSTLGIAGIKLDWDQVSSSTGPRDFLLQWSTNGTTFATINAYSVNANVSNGVRYAWNFNIYEPADHYTADLSSITAIENQSTVYFRLVDNSTTNAGGGNVGSTGTDRVDNFLVSRLAATSIQIGGGVAWIPGGSMAIKPDVLKDFQLTTNVTVFAGMVVNVTNAPIADSGTPSYFMALVSPTDDTAIATYQLTAKAGDSGNTNYVLGARTTDEPAAPFVFGTTRLSYGISYRVILRTDPLGTNTIVYVSPTSGVLDQQTPYLTASGGSGITPATILQSLILTESKNGSLATVGAGISKVCAASDYASVYNFLTGATPPVASFTGSPTAGTAPLNVTFSDTSTGSITNRFWDFGDGGTTNITTNVVAHTYAAGTYNVTLVVSGSDGVSTNFQAGYITSLTTFQAWQIQYFGSTNGSATATADPDGDGQNNLAEFLAGTDPTNTASAFRITSIVPEGNNLRITWSMGADRTNALQFTSGATGSYSTNFSDIFIVTNTVGTATNFLDLGAATNTSAGYYRIRLVQ
ncbi:MAG TPA: DNA/RNA non-specific endonuclease [Verrucomicrobiae bacterium]|nr:DNA/RNA non-specific endonuclease [Verrucomicrobiae bacterium]